MSWTAIIVIVIVFVSVIILIDDVVVVVIITISVNIIIVITITNTIIDINIISSVKYAEQGLAGRSSVHGTCDLLRQCCVMQASLQMIEKQRTPNQPLFSGQTPFLSPTRPRPRDSPAECALSHELLQPSYLSSCAPSFAAR